MPMIIIYEIGLQLSKYCCVKKDIDVVLIMLQLEIFNIPQSINGIMYNVVYTRYFIL